VLYLITSRVQIYFNLNPKADKTYANKWEDDDQGEGYPTKTNENKAGCMALFVPELHGSPCHGLNHLVQLIISLVPKSSSNLNPQSVVPEVDTAYANKQDDENH
jgi:hypothetical protein